MTPSVAAFRKTAVHRLDTFPHTTIPDSPGMRRAAVVVCVVEENGAPCIFVIKRAYKGRNAGQWGLPGGVLDPGETTDEAALRELQEEIGLVVDPADILGRLDDFPASSGFTITPIVVAPENEGAIELNRDEVHALYRVPLERLAAPGTPRWVPQMAGGSLLQMRLAPDMVIHPPTGAILWQFREVVLLDHHVRAADLLQPDWTSR